MKRLSLLFIPLDWQKKMRVQVPFFEALQTQFDARYYEGANGDLLRNKPDIIFIMSGAVKPDELAALKKLTKAKVIQWTGDCRAEPIEAVLSYKGIADKTFLASGIGQQRMYEMELEHPVLWLQHAASMFVSPKLLIEGGIAFVGNYYDQFPGGEERNRLCELLQDKYGDDFYCWGSWCNSRGQVPYDDTPWIYNNAYISISANAFNDIEGYWSNRPYDILAAGSCCLMRYVPGIEKHFEDMKHCVYYRNNDEALEKIEWLYANPKKRNRIALNGYRHVMENHTFVNRAMELWSNL